MKTVYALIVFFLNSTKIVAQQEKAIGRIIYERFSGKNVEFIEMWFSEKAYKYTTRMRPDEFIVVKKKYASAEDSIEVAKKNAYIKQIFSEGPPPQTWYGILGDEIVISKVELNNEPVITADTLQFVSWQILEDTMTISGVVCQKAAGISKVGKKKLIAWFAQSIPVSVAPYTLRGLPGLILEANVEDNSVQWNVLQLDWPVMESIKWQMPDKKLIVSKEERLRLMNKHNGAVMDLVEYYKKLEQEKAKKN